MCEATKTVEAVGQTEAPSSPEAEPSPLAATLQACIAQEASKRPSPPCGTRFQGKMCILRPGHPGDCFGANGSQWAKGLANGEERERLRPAPRFRAAGPAVYDDASESCAIVARCWTVFDGGEPSTGEDNARRIAACLNHAEGFSTKAVAAGPSIAELVSYDSKPSPSEYDAALRLYARQGEAEAVRLLRETPGGLYGPCGLASAHEGYAYLQECVDDLRAAVKGRDGVEGRAAVGRLVAMGLRYLTEVAERT